MVEAEDARDVLASFVCDHDRNAREARTQIFFAAITLDAVASSAARHKISVIGCATVRNGDDVIERGLIF
jgi:predicted RNA-binding protein with PIN domain